MDAERSRYINGHIVGTKSVEWRVESVQMSEVQMSDPKRIYEVVLDGAEHMMILCKTFALCIYGGVKAAYIRM